MQEKPSTKAGLSVSETDAVLAMVRRDSETVEIEPLDEPVCRDSDDDLILATGHAAQANCITTGDKDLLDATQRSSGIPPLVNNPHDCGGIMSRKPGK